MSIDVLLADDQDIVRAGLRLILDAEDDIRIVDEVGDGQAAVDRARLLRPDIVLMDIEMPVLDGIEATGRLTADRGTPGELVAALHTVAEGDGILSSTVTRRPIERFAQHGLIGQRDDLLDPLGPSHTLTAESGS